MLEQNYTGEQMNILCISFFFLLSSFFALHAQPADPLEFFPHKPGDMWIYQRWDYDTGKRKHEKIVIEKNSVDSAGNIYVLQYKITPNGEVYSNGGYRPEYKFSAAIGERWSVGGMYERGISRKYTISLWGKEIPATDMETYLWFPPDTGPQLWYTETFAAGIGFVHRWEYDSPSFDPELVAAIINGVPYGKITNIEEGQTDGPFSLGHNFPNPAQNSTQIPFTLPADSFTELNIYDLFGNRVVQALSGWMNAGSYSVPFSTQNLSAGMYIYELVSGSQKQRKPFQVQP